MRSAGPRANVIAQPDLGGVLTDVHDIQREDIPQPARAGRRIGNLHRHPVQSPWIHRESLFPGPGGPLIDRKAVVDEEGRPPRPVLERGIVPHAGRAVGSVWPEDHPPRCPENATVRFQTITWMPARKALAAIPWPIAPMPSTATGSRVVAIGLSLAEFVPARGPSQHRTARQATAGVIMPGTAARVAEPGARLPLAARCGPPWRPAGPPARLRRAGGGLAGCIARRREAR